jgi:hypothetical protein
LDREVRRLEARSVLKINMWELPACLHDGLEDKAAKGRQVPWQKLPTALRWVNPEILATVSSTLKLRDSQFWPLVAHSPSCAVYFLPFHRYAVSSSTLRDNRKAGHGGTCLNLSIVRQRKEDGEFEASLDYIVSLKPVWDHRKTLSCCPHPPRSSCKKEAIEFIGPSFTFSVVLFCFRF